MFRKRPKLKEWWGALSDIQKCLKLTLTSLGIFFALPSSKKKCFRVRFAMYTDCSKKWQFLSFYDGFWKNARLCDKNQISWSYVDKSIFFSFKDMDLIFYSEESWESILCNSNQFKRPSQKEGALHWSENRTFSWKNEFFKKISKGALWGALCILKSRRYQKWKKRPFFDLGPTYHAFKAPLRSSILVRSRKNPSFLIWDTCPR